MRDIDRTGNRSGTLFAGMVLIALGTLFLLDRADVVDFRDVMRHYWPLLVIGSGVAKLVHGEWWGGLWVIAVGTWMQMVTLHAFGLTWSTSWPFLLIVFGGGMVVRAFFAAARPERSESRGGRHES